MTPADIALPRVKAAEGYRPDPYTDTLGNLTTGYGCLLRGWSEPFASAVCSLQIANAEADCDGQSWYVGADVVRQSVLVELVFNMGVAKLLTFTHMIAALNAQDWSTAADELQNSVWFHQVGTRGPKLVTLLRNGG